MNYSADNTYDNLVLDSEQPVLLWAIIHIPQQNFFICIVNVKIQTKLCNCVMSIDIQVSRFAIAFQKVCIIRLP